LAYVDVFADKIKTLRRAVSAKIAKLQFTILVFVLTRDVYFRLVTLFYGAIREKVVWRLFQGVIPFDAELLAPLRYRENRRSIRARSKMPA
jgi:hypothetical protein